jgi:hypothetical protein
LADAQNIESGDDRQNPSETHFPRGNYDFPSSISISQFEKERKAVVPMDSTDAGREIERSPGKLHIAKTSF